MARVWLGREGGEGVGRGSHNARAFCAHDERARKNWRDGANRKNGLKNVKLVGEGHMSQAGSFLQCKIATVCSDMFGLAPPCTNTKTWEKHER
jgi:hypothetical protein